MKEEKITKFRGVDNAKIIEVIRVVSTIGTGTEKDPVRLIFQYWTLDGKLLTSKDSYLEDTTFLSNSL